MCCAKSHLSFVIFLKLAKLSLSLIISPLSSVQEQCSVYIFSLCLNACLLPAFTFFLHYYFLCYWFPVPSLNIYFTFSSAKDVNNIGNLLLLTSLESISMSEVMTKCFAESKPVWHKGLLMQRPSVKRCLLKAMGQHMEIPLYWGVFASTL